jgi:MFS family permease
MKEYWHFMINIGILAGVGSSLLFTPSISAIGHFFLVKRGIATGLAASGSAVGGIFFPLFLQPLIEKLGFAWATRILGFIIAFLSVATLLLVKTRLKPKTGCSILPNFKILGDPAFALTSIGVYFMEWALFIPITYLSSFVIYANVEDSAKFSFQVVSILNVGSFLGRAIPGIVADRIGRFNSIIIMLSICAIATLGIWFPLSLLQADRAAHSIMKPLIILYALIFGFASGSNVSLVPVCVGQLCDTEEYGRYYATCYTCVSFGTLTGLPIAGILLQACNGNYYGLIVFTTGCYIASFICFVTARVIKVGWKINVLF